MVWWWKIGHTWSLKSRCLSFIKGYRGSFRIGLPYKWPFKIDGVVMILTRSLSNLSLISFLGFVNPKVIKHFWHYNVFIILFIMNFWSFFYQVCYYKIIWLLSINFEMGIQLCKKINCLNMLLSKERHIFFFFLIKEHQETDINDHFIHSFTHIRLSNSKSVY